MLSETRSRTFRWAVAGCLLLAGCFNSESPTGPVLPEPVPTPTPVVTPTPGPTSTPAPTPPPGPTPTATASPTATRTFTPSPTPTATPRRYSYHLLLIFKEYRSPPDT